MQMQPFRLLRFRNRIELELLLSLFVNRFRTVLAVKGSLRRAKQRRALDRSGPFRRVFLEEGKAQGAKSHAGKNLRNQPARDGLNLTRSPENIAARYNLGSPAGRERQLNQRHGERHNLMGGPGRDSERPVVAKKPGNAGGAKGPY